MPRSKQESYIRAAQEPEACEDRGRAACSHPNSLRPSAIDQCNSALAVRQVLETVHRRGAAEKVRLVLVQTRHSLDMAGRWRQLGGGMYQRLYDL